MIQEDVSSVVSPVLRHLESGTDDEQISARQTEREKNTNMNLNVFILLRRNSPVNRRHHPTVPPGGVVECSGEQVVTGGGGAVIQRVEPGRRLLQQLVSCLAAQ